MRYRTIHNFLTIQECNEVIQLAKKRLYRSGTWNPEAGVSIYSDYRESEQMFFGVGETPLIRKIEARIARATKIPVENGEGLQLVHYSTGGYYKAHYDWFDPDPALVGNRSEFERGGQRIATVMIYLSYVAAGGSTYFPVVDVDIQPEIGKAVVWFNVEVSADGQSWELDTSTWHEGKPVIAGEKYIMTKWLRERPFRE